jgi:hypothetical protein
LQSNTAPLSDAIITAISRLIDDSQIDTKREPSHSDLDFIVSRVGLNKIDPKTQGQPVGKAKRMRTVLSWALDNNQSAGERLVKMLIENVRGFGGFRPDSSNYVGRQSIVTLQSAFKSEGYELSLDGDLRPAILDNLPEKELTQALLVYAHRARKGVFDAALVVGTGKDLLEAVAKHVLVVKFNKIDNSYNFPYLLAQAFMALDMVTSQHKVEPNEPSTKRYERALYELGCAVNAMRNKEGTGHGRPFLPTITQEQACNAVEAIGIIAEYMLRRL